MERVLHEASSSAGGVDQRYKQLVRLRLSLVHGCRTCNRQNVPGALAAGDQPGAGRRDGRGQRHDGPHFTDERNARSSTMPSQMVLTNMNRRHGRAELFARLRRAFQRGGASRARRRHGRLSAAWRSCPSSWDSSRRKTTARSRRPPRPRPCAAEIRRPACAGLRSSSSTAVVATSRASSPAAARSCAARQTASASIDLRRPAMRCGRSRRSDCCRRRERTTRRLRLCR